MYEELSAFIGLIVIELQNFKQKEFSYKYDDLNQEKIDEIKIIIERLYTILQLLDNKKDYDNICIKTWENEYKLGEKIISSTNKLQHPTGYCFVARAVCKRMLKNNLITDIYNFLEVLGYYIKYYYYDE